MHYSKKNTLKFQNPDTKENRYNRKPLKRKQLQMAHSGVIKSLAELMRWAGGVSVVKGKGDCKEEVDLDREDQESRLNLYKAGLTLEQIESKVKTSTTSRMFKDRKGAD